jgi:FdrA protein
MVERVALRRGRYADSVTLLQVSRAVTEAPGVEAALVAMATELNLQLLAGMGFQPPSIDSANDLLIAVRAAGDPELAAAEALAEQLLDEPRGSTATVTEQLPARTVGAAVRRYGPGLALISVPGQHAFTEAMDAVESGCDVLLFSDNVPVWQEVALKQLAAERGLLVMGPDCGTAVVGGIGLGFAHTVDPGPVGLVAASGTGAQQVLCLLDAAGVGVSAALGVGGRDLSGEVGGLATRQALDILDADPGTERILVISKPPAASVADRIRQHAAAMQTPTSFAFLGQDEPDLTQATEELLGELGVDSASSAPRPRWPSWLQERGPRPGFLRGLFCGGTLCDEAMLIASGRLGTIRSNIPLEPDWSLADPLQFEGDCLIDFGDDALTRGRAHPMIDPTLRNRQLRSAISDPATSTVLMDVVLGHGAHPDPAAELVPIIDNSEVPVIVSLIGARRDPQGLERTARRLHSAGASVLLSNAEATRHALSLISEPMG